MGRELKRVALDFGWPLRKVWRGYLCDLPYPKTCRTCNGHGTNAATRQIAEDFYDLDGFGDRWTYDYNVAPDGSPATRPPWRIRGTTRRWCDSLTQDEVDVLIRHGRLRELTGEHVEEMKDRKGRRLCWLTVNPVPLRTVTADRANHWFRFETAFGHDSINSWLLTEQRARRLGVYGKCPACKGSGSGKYPRKLKKAHATWKQKEPPAGPGFQLWETVSEGSPVSPVFPTADGLIEWMVSHERYSREAATRFVGEVGWVPSMIGISGVGVYRDVETVMLADKSTIVDDPAGL